MREHIVAWCILTWQCQEVTPGAISPHWPDTKNVLNAHFHPWTMLGSVAETWALHVQVNQSWDRFCQMNLEGTAENANWPWARNRDRYQKWGEKIKSGLVTTELDVVLWELCKCNCLCAIWTTLALFKEVLCTLWTRYPRVCAGSYLRPVAKRAICQMSFCLTKERFVSATRGNALPTVLFHSN